MRRLASPFGDASSVPAIPGEAASTPACTGLGSVDPQPAPSRRRDVFGEGGHLLRVDVLVVDDDVGIRATWAAILRLAGYSVSVAEDGDTALRELKEFDVGLVLLDLRMPGRDGFSVLES